jgi:hypothetical protein
MKTWCKWTFWILVAAMVLLLALLYFFYPYFFRDSYFYLEEKDNRLIFHPSNSCYLLIANLFHLIVIITGIFCVYLVTKLLGTIKEKYFLGLIAVIAFFIYFVIDYDPLQAKWQHNFFKPTTGASKDDRKDGQN